MQTTTPPASQIFETERKEFVKSFLRQYISILTEAKR